MKRLPPPPEHVMRAAEYAEPPGPYPKGYFDNLMPITHRLLDKAMKLYQIADFLIESQVITAEMRHSYQQAMRARFSRTRAKRITKSDVWTWMASPYLNAVHLCSSTEERSLCGTAATWVDWPGGSTFRCNRCRSLANKNKLKITNDD